MIIDIQPSLQTNSITFEFLSTIYSKHLNCKICYKLMLQPIRLHQCGHTLCSSCVQNKNVKQCPICLLKIHAKQKDILASKLVGELAVRCMNSGCPWKGSFQQFKNFHERGCRLKNGGIDAWLKQLQSTISENTLKYQVRTNKEQQEDERERASKNLRDQKEHQYAQNEQQNQKFSASIKKGNIQNRNQKQPDQLEQGIDLNKRLRKLQQ